MASSFANPYGSRPGPQKDIASAFQPSFGPANAYTPQAKPSSAPKTQGTPYQSYAQQGQAQSIPPQSQGTPYQAYSQPSKPTLRPAGQTITGDSQGAYAAAPASQRPPPFQMGTAQTPWGQSMDPFVERDAFINQLNQQRIQNQIAFNSGGFTDPTAGMTPGLNYQQAMQQAGLGGGAPSMAANYGDSLIQRLNQSFGGQGDPFAFANQQGYYQPQGAPVMTTQAQASLPPQGTFANQPSYKEFNPAGLGAAPQPQNSGLPLTSLQGSQPVNYAPSKYSLGLQNPEANGEYWRRQQMAQNAYLPVSAVGPPPQPTTSPANPYGAPVTDRPAPAPYTPPPSWAGSGGYNPGWGVMQGPSQQPRYVPMAPVNNGVGVNYEARQKNASEFKRQLEQTNPATWTDSQWNDYRQASADTMMMDGGGYSRDASGNVFYYGGYGVDTGRVPVTASSTRDQYGTWRGGQQASRFRIPETPDMMRNRPSPGSPQPPAYTPPPNGTIRIDPVSGKMVAYKDGQWTWEPNPISGPQPYDTSRFGDGTPPASMPKAGQAQPIQPPSQGQPSGSRMKEWVAAGRPGNPEIHLMQLGKSKIDGTGFGSITEAAAYDRWLESQGVGQPSQGTPYQPPQTPGQAQPIAPPSQGTPYGQPADPYAVNDLKSLPFYKSLRVGDKVRKRESGQYDVYDSSGVAVETYNPGRTEPSVSMKRAREPLFLYQNEGMASQQLGDIQLQREKDAKQKAAGDAWIKGAPARLEKEREAIRNSPLGKQAQAKIDQMQAEVANLERNLSKGSLSDKNAKLKRIRELKGQIASTVIR